jgi:hypothetical protein
MPCLGFGDSIAGTHHPVPTSTTTLGCRSGCRPSLQMRRSLRPARQKKRPNIASHFGVTHRTELRARPVCCGRSARDTCRSRPCRPAWVLRGGNLPVFRLLHFEVWLSIRHAPMRSSRQVPLTDPALSPG